VSLRIRVFGLVMASVLPAVGVELYNEYRHHEERREAVKVEAERQAQLLAAEIGRSIEGLAQSLRVVAHAEGPRRSDAEGCERLLADLGAAAGAAGPVVVIDREGRPLCRPGTPGYADRPWVQEALLTGSAVGSYAVEAGLGGAGLPVAIATRDASGEVQGAALGALDVSGLAQRLRQRPMPPGSSVTVADREGVVLVRLPNGASAGGHLPADWGPLAAAAHSGAVEVSAHIDGAERIVGYVPRAAAPGGLFVAVGYADDAALAPMLSSGSDALALMVLAVLLAMALSWFVSERLVHRPLDVLTRTARQLRGGDLGTRAELAPSDASEFGGLGSTFNELAETLQEREQERAITDEQLRRARDEAEAASRSKTHFLASVSHDLRQPLHSMSLTTDLLRLRLQGRPEAELADRLGRSVVNLVDLVNAVLDVSQLDAGLIVPQVEDFALDRLLQGTADEFADEAARKGVALDVDIAIVWVRSDMRLLRRIVHNLVANAVKYTPAGGSVRVRCVPHDGQIEIQVVDTGRGIPPERQAEIWEEFRQLDNPARDPAKGLGLGLSIVRRMALLLAHPITLRSEPGTGTAVSVRVPTAPARAAKAGPAAPPRLAGRLLLVEDDAGVAASTAGMLREWGLEVRVARTAEAAIAAIAEAARPFDAVLTDFRLPGRSGLDVVASAQLRWPWVRVVVMTGDVGANLKDVVAEGVPVLAKPVSAMTLAAALAPLAASALEHDDPPTAIDAHAAKIATTATALGVVARHEEPPVPLPSSSPSLASGPDGVLQRAGNSTSTMAAKPP
jgi:signal transduction histidine kinase/FixJ family two-component response regulator